MKVSWMSVMATVPDRPAGRWTLIPDPAQEHKSQALLLPQGRSTEPYWNVAEVTVPHSMLRPPVCQVWLQSSLSQHH